MPSRYGFPTETRDERIREIEVQEEEKRKKEEAAQRFYQEFLYRPEEEQYRVLLNVARPEIYLRVLKGIPGLEIISGKNEAQLSVAVTIVEGMGGASKSLPEGNLLLISPEDKPPITGGI